MTSGTRRRRIRPGSSARAPRAGRSWTGTASCWPPTGPASPSMPRPQVAKDPATLGRLAALLRRVAGRHPADHRHDAAKPLRPPPNRAGRADGDRDADRGKQAVPARRQHPAGTRALVSARVSLAAQLLGTMGRINGDEWKTLSTQRYADNSREVFQRRLSGQDRRRGRLRGVSQGQARRHERADRRARAHGAGAGFAGCDSPAGPSG